MSGPAQHVVPVAPTRGMAVDCGSIGFTYAEGGSPVAALRDVSLTLAPGAALALLGASGSGKSTLLQVLRGLDAPESGCVLLDGLGPGEPAYAGLQREVGLVFQSPELQLFAATATEDVAFGPRQLGWSEAEVAAAVADAMDVAGLPEDRFGRRHPYALSGGERRRLALAGVLAMRPRLLLLDEPFVSLDPATRAILAGILRRLRRDGVSLVLATHDVDLAWSICDEVLVLEGGRVAASGAWSADSCAGVPLAGGVREPFLVQLWRRLGRDPAAAPRTVEEAAEALR